MKTKAANTAPSKRQSKIHFGVDQSKVFKLKSGNTSAARVPSADKPGGCSGAH
jgi:hypothetical protein